MRSFAGSNGLKPIVMGVLCGLAFARLWVDFFEPEAAAILLFPIGFIAGYFWPRWTCLGLLVYLASPFPLPHLAILVVSLAVMGWITPLKSAPATLFTGITAFFIFLLTLSPGLLPADAGEFQVVAAEWGVAHPPGYPLYTMLAGLFAHVLPFESAAWRVNLFSAVIGALTVAVVTYTVRRETGKIWAGWLAGLALMVSITFWMTSTQASIRPMTAFFTALMIEAATRTRYIASLRDGYFPFIRFGLAAGLGVTHHGSLFFIGLALAIGIFAATFHHRKKWPLMGIAGLAGMIPWLYLLVRADGFLAPAGLDTWDGFRNHVLARGFSGDMFAYLDPSYWPERWQVMKQVYLLQWHPWILLLTLAGLMWAIWKERWLGLTLLLAFLTHTIVAGTYRAPQTVEYALPACVILVVALGYFIGKIQTAPVILATIALSGILFSFQTGWVTMQRLASQEEARQSALATLEQTPENGLILASWHRATPLWYLQRVENRRTDAEVRYVNPEGNLTPMQRWVNLIEEAIQQKKIVVVTQNFSEAYRVLPYTFENERILATPAPPAGNAINLANRIGLIENPNFERDVYAGENTRFELNWNVAITPGEISTFIHIGTADQPPIAQTDLFFHMNAPGQVRQFYDVHIPITAPPGEWQVWTGGYTVGNTLLPTESGETRILTGTVTIHPAKFPAPTQHSVFRKMGAANLIGWDYDSTINGETMLYLHWNLREKAHAYRIQIVDIAGGIWAEANVVTKDKTGYWTSVHQLPSDIVEKGVTVRIDRHEMKLPAATGDEHYILIGNIAALVDWRVEFEGDSAITEITLLPFGASFEDIQIQIATPATSDFTPVSGSIPSFKWAYGREITSRQTIKNIQSREIRFLLYDGLTGRVIPVLDRRFSSIRLE